MRQAFVIKNPKWELFTKASDAFKDTDAPSILVVRGRCKEKKVAKILVKLTKSAAAIIVATLFSVVAFGQASIQGNLPTAELAGATTNAGPGGGLLGWNIDQIAVLQGAVYSSNNVHISTKSNVFIRFNTSLNGTDWVTNAYNIALVTDTFQTNTLSTIARITNTTGAKWLQVGAVENANTNRVYIPRLHWETKQQ